MTKRKKRKSNRPQKYSHQELAQQAQKALSSGRYREAIVHYKKLIKQQDVEQGECQAWLDALAQSYLGRAQQLAKKSMVQEAITLWKQRAKVCQRPLLDDCYVGWLIQSGEEQGVFELYREQWDELTSVQVGEVRRRLAACLLGCDEEQASELLSHLEREDPLATGYRNAATILQAHCGSDHRKVEQLLQKISFRSPYRELRTLIKGELQKIDTNSPFRPLADLLQYSRDEGVELLPVLRVIDRAGLENLLELKGWGEREMQMVQAWQRLDAGSSGLARLEFLRRFRELNPGNAEQGALGILFDNIALTSPHQRHFGPLQEWQRDWFAALEAETLQFEESDIERYWRQLLKSLPEGDGQNLKRALICNHIVEMAERLYRTLPSVCFNRKSKRALARLMRQGLEYDGNDQQGWVRLIRWERELNRLKESRDAIDRALEYFPESIEVLEEAAETAFSGNAYKKAARYANRVLKLDPVNHRVKQLLFESHFNHAHKQLERAMYPQCDKELDQAAQWTTDAESRGKLALARASHALRQQQSGVNGWFEQARCELEDGVSLRFLWQRYHHRADSVALAQIDTVASLEDLMRLARLIEQEISHWYRNSRDSWELAARLSSWLLPWRPILQQAAQWSDLAVTDYTVLCALWLRDELAEIALAHLYAEEALRRWPDHLLLQFYRLQAEEEQGEGADLEALGVLLSQAREQHDERVVHLLLENFPKLRYEAADPLDEEDEEEDENGGEVPIDGLFDDMSAPGTEEEIRLLMDQIPLGRLISRVSAKLPFRKQAGLKGLLQKMYQEAGGDDVSYKLLLLSMLEEEGQEIIERVMNGGSF